MFPRRSAGLLVAVALPFAGCAGGSRKQATHPATATATTATTAPAPPPPGVAPPAGRPVSALSPPARGPAMTVGSGYTVRRPRGWQDITGDPKLEGGRYEIAVADHAHHTVTVARHQAPVVHDATLLARVARADAKLSDATSASAAQPVVLDGVQAFRIGYRFRLGRERAAVRLVVALHDGFIYQVRLLTTLADVTTSVAAFDAMVSSWRWTG